MTMKMRHVGIYVENIDRMVDFYRELFQLEIVVHQTEKGAYTDTIFNEKLMGVEVYKLQFPDKSMIELLKYRGSGTALLQEKSADEMIYQTGRMHIAITVDSAENVYSKLVDKGCQILSPPCISADGKARVFFARDPEGNYLEIVEEIGRN